MKTRLINYIIFFVLVALLTGCYQTLKVNGVKRYTISLETVETEITAKVRRGYKYSIRFKLKRGDIEVNPNGIGFIYIPPKIDSETVYFIYKKETANNIFHVKKGESFVCEIYAYPYFQLYELGYFAGIDEINILSDDFITHNRKSLITDTLKISVPGYSEKYNERQMEVLDSLNNLEKVRGIGKIQLKQLYSTPLAPR